MEDQSNKDELIRMLVDGDPITARNLIDDRSVVEFLHFIHYRKKCLDGTEFWLGIERYKILRSSILVRIESIKIIGMETAYRHMDSPTRREGRISFLGLLGRNNPNDWDNELSDKERFYLCTDDNGGILTKYNSEGVCSIVGSLIWGWYWLLFPYFSEGIDGTEQGIVKIGDWGRI